MPFFTKDAQKTHGKIIDRRRVKRDNITRKRVISVKSWRDRLVKCGIPEKTAQRIIDYFFKNRRTVELIAYVRMTEEALGR